MLLPSSARYITGWITLGYPNTEIERSWWTHGTKCGIVSVCPWLSAFQVPRKRPLCGPHGMLAYGPASGVGKPVPANYVELSRRVAGYSALIQRHIHCASEADVFT